MKATVRQVSALLVLLVVLAAAGAVVWTWLADPAPWVKTDRGLVLTEEAAGRQIGVELLFVALGCGVSLLWGLLAGAVLRRLGWVVVPLVLAATLAASVLTWRLGVLFGPEGPLASRDLPRGTRVPSQLAVDSPASFLVWAIAGLVGVLLATWIVGRRPDVNERSDPAPLR